MANPYGFAVIHSRNREKVEKLADMLTANRDLVIVVIPLDNESGHPIHGKVVAPKSKPDGSPPDHSNEFIATTDFGAVKFSEIDGMQGVSGDVRMSLSLMRRVPYSPDHRRAGPSLSL